MCASVFVISTLSNENGLETKIRRLSKNACVFGSIEYYFVIFAQTKTELPILLKSWLDGFSNQRQAIQQKRLKQQLVQFLYHEVKLVPFRSGQSHKQYKTISFSVATCQFRQTGLYGNPSLEVQRRSHQSASIPGLVDAILLISDLTGHFACDQVFLSGVGHVDNVNV